MYNTNYHITILYAVSSYTNPIHASHYRSLHKNYSIFKEYTVIVYAITE